MLHDTGGRGVEEGDVGFFGEHGDKARKTHNNMRPSSVSRKCSLEFSRLNFQPSEYNDARGNTRNVARDFCRNTKRCGVSACSPENLKNSRRPKGGPPFD
jgi:hypothetical protein